MKMKFIAAVLVVCALAVPYSFGAFSDDASGCCNAICECEVCADLGCACDTVDECVCVGICCNANTCCE